MTAEDTASQLTARWGEAIRDVVHFRGEVSVVVPPESIVDICSYCRDELSYTYMSDLTAVDWLDRHPRFDVVYQLMSFTDWSRFRLKVQVDEGQSVPSVVDVWPGANWAEREVWDLFGIVFDGHPDLRRIQMPDDWIGHPLRKDFAQTQISLPRPKADKVRE